MIRLVLMAAGQATRMGRDKLALPWRGGTVLNYVLREVLRGTHLTGDMGLGQSNQIVVISRRPMPEYLSAEVCQAFAEAKGVWRLAPGPQPVSATIRQGLAELTDLVTGIGFLPGDQVGVKSEELTALLRAFADVPDILAPVNNSGKGAPVFFHRRYVSDLLSLQGEEGGRKVMEKYLERIRTVPVCPGFFADVDTPEDYARLYQLATQ